MLQFVQFVFDTSPQIPVDLAWSDDRHILNVLKSEYCWGEHAYQIIAKCEVLRIIRDLLDHFFCAFNDFFDVSVDNSCSSIDWLVWTTADHSKSDNQQNYSNILGSYPISPPPPPLSTPLVPRVRSALMFFSRSHRSWARFSSSDSWNSSISPLIFITLKEMWCWGGKSIKMTDIKSTNRLY